MRKTITAGILMSALAVALPAPAQNNTDELAQLRQRIAQLEKQVEQISKLIEPLKLQQAADSRRKILRDKFEEKMAQDRQKYTREQLREAEQLYQVASQKWGSPEANESLETMMKKYPDINRTGCAALYIAQKSEGEQRAKRLRDCVEKHNDCFYGDGVQVGAYARFLLATDLMSTGDKQNAEKLLNELRANYAAAVDHSGKLLAESIKAESDK